MQIEELQNKKVAILGLGVEGVSTVNYLVKHGITPVVFDEQLTLDNLSIQTLKEKGIKFLLGSDVFTKLSDFDVIFRSPGISPFREELVEFKKKGGILSFFFSIGGFFFFIIPAFLFAYFFMFMSFEVVCDNQRGINAFKRSYAITTGHFGEIFVRAVLMIVINLVVSFLGEQIVHNNPVLTLVWVIIAILFSWYQIVYFFTLYQQAKAQTDFSKPTSLVWVWVISILGWLIFVFVMFMIVTSLINLVKSGALQKFLQSYSHSNTPTPTVQNNININYVTPAAGAVNTYGYPTTAPTIDYNAQLQQQEKQAQQMQQQMMQQYNQNSQQNNQQLQQNLQQQQQQYNQNVQQQ